MQEFVAFIHPSANYIHPKVIYTRDNCIERMCIPEKNHKPSDIQRSLHFISKLVKLSGDVNDIIPTYQNLKKSRKSDFPFLLLPIGNIKL